MTWLDLTPDLTEEGQTRVKVGQILIFMKPVDAKDYHRSDSYVFPGETYLKIMRKHKGKVWAKEIQLYRPDQIEVVDKADA